MKRIRTWAARLPRLSRGGKTVRNLLLCLLLVVPFLRLGSWLPFFPTLAFHRLERTNLVPRGEIVFYAVPLPWENGVTEVELGGESADFFDTAVVGVSENWAAVMSRDARLFHVYPRGQGPDPVPMPMGHIMVGRVEDGQPDIVSLIPLLFLDVPQGTARAEVEMDIPYEGEVYHRAGAGTRQESGAWLFALEPPDNRENGSTWSEDWYEGASYTLRTYGGDGALTGTFRGVVPEAV